MGAGTHGYAPAVLGMLVLALAGLPHPARAQSAVPVKLTITVAGETRTVRGSGQCRHEPQASIYGTAAMLWLAEYGEAADGATGATGAARGNRATGAAGAKAAGAARVSLSYWRPKAAGAADQFQLSVTRGGRTHVINTVKGGRPAGSGRGSFHPTALGGRFEINGTAQDGATLQATIECARFGGIVAEGG